jgi:pyruvate/2-oxoglutarate dehydrogenase complex dihydrolipoamide acyltransferase (E2) component
VTVGPAAPGRHRLSPRARRQAADAERHRTDAGSSRVDSGQASGGQVSGSQVSGSQVSGSQATCVVEVDVTTVVELSRKAASVVRDGPGSGPTLTSFFASAAVSALHRHPRLHASVAAGDPATAAFTVADHGSLGVLWDTPTLVPGQVAALGVGAVVERVVVRRRPDDERVFAIRSMTYLALSYDPRFVGADEAARYLTDLKDHLESGRLDLGPS